MNALTEDAELLLDELERSLAHAPPAGVSSTYLSGFFRRHRPRLLHLLARVLTDDDEDEEPAPPPPPSSLPPDLWTPAQRTAANLKAMELLARKAPEHLSAQDQAALTLYSGWGGLSIDKVKHRFPEGALTPEQRGLIHEYYTPSKVAAEVARVVKPLLDELKSRSGRVLALEPSAGIGRFVRALSGPGFEALDWMVVEWSALSARLLQVLRPDLDVFQGPFERWVRERGPKVQGKLKLLVTNPPYGARGASVSEDPAREYREKAAYAYFLRRGLDLLAPHGLGVVLIPGGFLTGRAVANQKLRAAVLRRHHLSAAFRLPSELFPGVNIVTDLLFFRARGVELPDVLDDDRFIADGDYFKRHYKHILGKEVGPDEGADQPTGKFYRYRVEGTFTGLPWFSERPICSTCAVPRSEETDDDVPSPFLATSGVARQVRDETEALSDKHALAASLGMRVDRYLTLVSAGTSDEPTQLWGELHAALTGWRARHGNPWMDVALVALSRPPRSLTGVERFLTAFTKLGDLIPGLQQAPVVTRRYTGRSNDVLALADWLFQSRRELLLPELEAAWREHNAARFSASAAVAALTAAGWYWDRDPRRGTGPLLPAEQYLTGHLWPRYDRAKVLADQGDAIALAHVRALVDAIKPATYDEIDGLSPRQGWIPLDIVERWLNARVQRKLGHLPPVRLERKDGLVGLADQDYSELDKDNRAVAPETLSCLGWINHDRSLFRPKKQKQSDDLDEVRLKVASDWESDFRVWLGHAEQEPLRARLEESYNRLFRGYLTPTFAAEPLPIARWAPQGPRLHAHQVAGARRVLANKGGLVAFDVGVGKTYTGIAILARARQEGWVKRPVVLIPNSIIWKWEADVRRVLPDYRIAVIGSKRKVISRGPRKGLLTSENDTPEERAQKWTRFQAGEYDVVLLTYTALGRTRMNEDVLRTYAERTEAILREIALRQRNAEGKDELTERQEAILKEGTAAWIAEKMELPADWKYDPGVAWDDIGIDLLIVDEAQNYKNLHMPEEREGGVPRFMGNPGDGSKRAWQLDFRCAAIRRRTGGRGIVLLSATPAKNSPLEFYNLIQYVDPGAWTRLGITDPEQFIDRYLKIEIKPIVTPKLEVEDRGAVVGFQNLHELRDVIFRYGDFKTAEEVGLRLPEPKVEMAEVDMDAAQDAKYEHYVAAIEDALKSTNPKEKQAILGLLARLALVAIHPELDEGYDWKTADRVSDPSSPKFEALADRVLANRTCGHIVFVDNVAAHAWVKDVLVGRGIPADRIAVLNAEVAEASADRQRIAMEFNGNADEGVEPKYDVVIANAIAYEGIDLQTRTCAIHHLDLPWEPATLQQRNGRGVRQGNTLGAIAIYYYFARRSQDGLRFNLIQGKRGWMTQLLQSQDRDTNNPAAQMELGPEETLLLISRDPEKTRARLQAVKVRREAEARAKIALEASRLLRSINARFRQAERSRDATEAARLRAEAEARLKDLARTSPEAWPWLAEAAVVRERPVLVPEGGGPLYEGLRLAVPSAWDPNRTEYAEIGRPSREGGMGLRVAGSAVWQAVESTDARFKGLTPAHYNTGWSPTDEADALRDLQSRAERAVRDTGQVSALGWHLAPETWVGRMWSQGGRLVLDALGRVPVYLRSLPKIPALGLDGLRVLAGQQALAVPDQVLPPTELGWRSFLGAAPKAELTFTQLQEVARYWWNRNVPRNLLSEGREGANAEPAEEAA